MSILARPAFLAHLKSLYPESARENPWYIIAAVGYATANRPEAIPMVFHHALKDIDSSNQDSKLLLARRLRDALFKGGLMCGYPKVINGLKALFDVTPEDLRDTKPLRDTSVSISEFAQLGRSYYKHQYGEDAHEVQSTLDAIYPDMGWFSNLVGYGLVYSYDGVLTPAETSYVIVTAAIAGDTPPQIAWHLRGARRNGATLEEVQAVRKIAIEVAKESGVVWRNEVPELVDPTDV